MSILHIHYNLNSREGCTVNKLEEKLGKVESFFINISILLLFITMSIIIMDVVGRNVFNRPIKGSVELIEFLLVIIIYLSVSFTEKNKENVGIDFFIQKKMEQKRFSIIYMVGVLNLLPVLLILVFSAFKTAQLLSTGEVSIYLSIPKWPIPLFVTIGSLILSLRLIIDTINKKVI